MSSQSVVTVIERSKVKAINREHELCERASRDAITHAITCGQMLAAVKVDLGHGNWTPWLEDHFAGSERTAQVYMQLAGSPDLDPQTAAGLSIAGALRQISRPRPQPSPREAAALVSGLVDDDDERPPAVAEAASEPAWVARHGRRQARILAVFDAIRVDVERAGPDLSAHAIEDLLRGAATRTRQVGAEIESLAFEFAS